MSNKGDIVQQRQGVIASNLRMGDCEVFETTDVRTVFDTLVSRHGKFANDKFREGAREAIENGVSWKGCYYSFTNDKGETTSICLLPATINVK